MIYLDYAANTPADEEVIRRFCETERAYIGNANSSHCAGAASKELLAQTTNSIARLLGVLPSGIIYTSGASESNNTAIKGIAAASKRIGKHIVSTPLEHSSVKACLDYLRDRGFEIDLVKIGKDGRIDLNDLLSLIRNDTVLVSVTAVDSELGVIQPIKEISDIVRTRPDCRLHVDATQAVGKIPFSFDCADAVSFAPHKFYGLNGCGVLYKRRSVELEPLVHGGSGATPYRSGTPPLALIASCETALRLACEKCGERFKVVEKYNWELREFFSGYPKVRINSPDGAVPYILNLSVDGVKGTAFQKKLNEHGICVSVKSACSTDGKPSSAVLAVSGSRKSALSSWRISLSHLTTEDELSEFKEAFDACYREMTK